MNAHSPSWNPHCARRKNAGTLEELIDLSLLSTTTVGRKRQPNTLSISTKSKKGVNKDVGLRKHEDVN